MRPAPSVILLTTLCGAGQGVLLGLASASFMSPAEKISPSFVLGAIAVAGLLNVLGLVASFFHLGHPERAWRAATMWRTSWLSREVIALPVFVASLAMLGWANLWAPEIASPLLWVAVLLCFVLYVCTGMIYASLRFLQEWATPLTVINFILMGSSMGCAIITLMASVLAPDLVQQFVSLTTGLVLIAGIGRLTSLRRNRYIRAKSTVKSATGISQNNVKLKFQGFMGAAFAHREFSHGQTRVLVRIVKWAFLLLAFTLPLLLLLLLQALPLNMTLILSLVCISQFLGQLAERWYFFAEAKHPQNLYYEAIA
jgi:DMSO reductase anchor subunit